MEQPRVERVFHLLRLMTGTRLYSVEELAAQLETSPRSIYRYIDTFRILGFAIDKLPNNVYRMVSYPATDSYIENCIYFTQAEAKMICNFIEGIDGPEEFKANFYKKLSAIYNYAELKQFDDCKNNLGVRIALKDAIDNHKKVILKKYSSPNSGTIKDRNVEPFAFANNYVDIWAYDTDVHAVRIFKITRIQKAEVLDEAWEFESKHIKSDIDAFHMSGVRNIHVRLELTLRSKNLLSEEYPLAIPDIKKVGRSWIYDSYVCQLQGVGRFCMGLANDIKILECAGLREHILNCREHETLFSN